ncbi:nitrate transporter CrnA [Cordyceps fumosorosea ARSEF 2679]|uniref:Nitrate/nitrite transporter n=1 Tax=Cordyceps fumosorosea (strain ARSEF 2679) TaxID=1081104 RepID=A0A167RLM4_CORFA|nr:nitrate transporter CrnA [Cordyceps fumosorosea ARSEF 2679]OAA58717.1 nitrate transporter CrnA [Cordyceps fumosorosea ARSEF 2679]
MAFKVATFWQAPELNPVNGKARSIPVLNPLDRHGRVFFFSWLGFMVAFLSWYAFPPLLTLTIKKDLNLTPTEIANSNIVALASTLFVRVVSGPSCDYFGPKVTFAACLLLGAIPSALAGTVTTANGLMTLRFFIGVLGGTFVPCQVWTTSFFDKNVVGTANALTAGWGNAGGGITYFIMPTIFDSLVEHQHLTPHVAWRVAFVVPFILITSIALGMMLLCDDCATGKWSERHDAVKGNLRRRGLRTAASSAREKSTGDLAAFSEPTSDDALAEQMKNEAVCREAELSDQELLDAANGEVVKNPTLKDTLMVTISPQTVVVAAIYMCSFGAELAINSVLGAYYFKNFKALGQTGTGRWAAMFGLLNVVFRPLGGVVSDALYRASGNVWSKKIWLCSLGVVCGVFQIAIGVTDSHSKSTMFGLMAGMAFFLEAGNGACFSLVPHVHPAANGIISGMAGAAGNLGGIIFAIIFRYQGADYGKTFWVIGVITVAINLLASWVKPLPAGQIGGR